MRLAWFPGCKSADFTPQYAHSSQAVLRALGHELVEPEFGCCGYPIRHQSFEAHLVQSARALAQAEALGLDIVTPCKCCFGNMTHAAYMLRADAALLERINKCLAGQGLTYTGHAQPFHLLQVITRVNGLDDLRQRVRQGLDGLPVAVQYGCHALRPSRITGFDDPGKPLLLDDVVEAAGCASVEWTHKLSCCGNPILAADRGLSLGLTRRKLASAVKGGAELMVTACNYCHIQFDQVQAAEPAAQAGPRPLPVATVTQVLGLALGLPAQEIGLDRNATDSSWLARRLKPAA